MSWEEAISLPTKQHDIFLPSEIPSHVKHEAVSLHLLIARAAEEVARLKMEMHNCVCHYVSEYQYLSEAKSTLITSDYYSQGSVSLLSVAIKVCEQRFKELNALKQYIELPQIVNNYESGLQPDVSAKEVSMKSFHDEARSTQYEEETSIRHADTGKQKSEVSGDESMDDSNEGT